MPKDFTPAQNKANIVKKILKRYDNKLSRDNIFMAGKGWGKFTSAGLYIRVIITHRFSLSELMIAVATDNKEQIKKVIDKRINLRGDII